VLAIGNKQDLLPISFEKKKSERAPQGNFDSLRVFFSTPERAACTGRILVLNNALRVRCTLLAQNSQLKTQNY
jgi:hypothetical protein